MMMTKTDLRVDLATQDTGSDNDFKYESSGGRDGGVQDESELRSSEVWDSEVDCYPLSDISEDEVSIEGNAVDTCCESPAHPDDGDDSLSANPACIVHDLRLDHGYTLKGADVESLRRMALSSTTICTEFTELLLMRTIINELDDKRIHA